MQELTTLQTVIVFASAGVCFWIIAKALINVYLHPPPKASKQNPPLNTQSHDDFR